MFNKSVTLNIVTNEELFTSLIVGSIIIVAAISGILLNVYFILRRTQQRNNFIRIIFLVIFLGITFFLFKELKNNYLLYKNSKVIQGTVTGFCKTDRAEDGVTFEYIYDGKKYHNCNPYFPFPKDSIIIGNSYPVKINTQHPEMGRIILKK